MRELTVQPPGLLITLAVLAGAASPVPAQILNSSTELSPQIWVDYNPSWTVSPLVQLYGDIGARTELESGGWWRLVVRPSIRYQRNAKLRFSGGLGFFFTANDLIADRLEIRPWQGVAVDWPTGRVRVEHFVRLEEQFDFNLGSGESLNSIRIRYRLRPSVEWDRDGVFRYWRVLASVEAFARLAGQRGQFDEEVRLTLGIERSFYRGLRLRLDATWQKEGAPFDSTIEDVLLRVRIFSAR